MSRMTPSEQLDNHRVNMAVGDEAIETLREWHKLDKRIAKLEAALREVRTILTVPAAEYVPAITDAWACIDAALQQ